VFALSNGPLLVAIAVWRNSFVFHSVDRVTTTLVRVRVRVRGRGRAYPSP
jgi:hypothetical protein